jgi:uncharacterized SAM-binding protein YcdF (DUF218 family)
LAANLKHPDMTAPAQIGPPIRSASRPSLRALKRVLAPLLLLAAITAAAWSGRAVLLRAAADLWGVSDPVVPADAVVVLGGGIGTRPFAASEYYRKGLVPRVLVSNVRQTRIQELGIVPSDAALARSVLVQLGVPEEVIEELGSGLSNTYEEAVALRVWAQHSQVRSVLVPTEIFSARRVRWVFDREFAGTGIRIAVPALDVPEYDHSKWWKDDKGIIAFQNEVLKYFYYRMKY